MRGSSKCGEGHQGTYLSLTGNTSQPAARNRQATQGNSRGVRAGLSLYLQKPRSFVTGLMPVALYDAGHERHAPDARRPTRSTHCSIITVAHGSPGLKLYVFTVPAVSGRLPIQRRRASIDGQNAPSQRAARAHAKRELRRRSAHAESGFPFGLCRRGL